MATKSARWQRIKRTAKVTSTWKKQTVRPAKTQISLGIRPVWSESSLSAWRKRGSLSAYWAQMNILVRLGGCPGWSESSLVARSFCWFCHEAAHMLSKDIICHQLARKKVEWPGIYIVLTSCCFYSECCLSFHLNFLENYTDRQS